METNTLTVTDYYGNQSYYTIIPETIFDALELASLRGEQTTTVDKVLFDAMIIKYKEKMAEWQGK